MYLRTFFLIFLTQSKQLYYIKYYRYYMFYYIIVNISNCLRDDRFEFGKKLKTWKFLGSMLSKFSVSFHFLPSFPPPNISSLPVNYYALIRSSDRLTVSFCCYGKIRQEFLQETKRMNESQEGHKVTIILNRFLLCFRDDSLQCRIKQIGRIQEK